jgi:hypothetical protein
MPHAHQSPCPEGHGSADGSPSGAEECAEAREIPARLDGKMVIRGRLRVPMAYRYQNQFNEARPETTVKPLTKRERDIARVRWYHTVTALFTIFCSVTAYAQHHSHWTDFGLFVAFVSVISAVYAWHLKARQDRNETEIKTDISTAEADDLEWMVHRAGIGSDGPSKGVLQRSKHKISIATFVDCATYNYHALMDESAIHTCDGSFYKKR